MSEDVRAFYEKNAADMEKMKEMAPNLPRISGKHSGHHENFIKAVRSRKPSDLNAEILQGHLSTALCHMGNISYRVGQDASLEEVSEVIRTDAQVLDALEHPQHTVHVSTDGEQTCSSLLARLWIETQPGGAAILH